MKYILFLLPQLLALNSIFSQNDTTWFNRHWKKTTRDKAAFFRPTPVWMNGKYKVIDYYVSNGKIQGIAFSLKKMEEVFDSLTIIYKEDGSKESEFYYNKGKLQGPATSYYPNGKIKETLNWVNGSIEGEINFYYENEKLKTKTFYVHNMKNGLLTEYYESGAKRGTANYKNDSLEGELNEYFEEGGLKLTRTYFRNKKTGQETGYFPSGKIYYKAVFVNDTLEGPFTEFYENGKVKKEGLFKKNEQVEAWKEYDEQGNFKAPETHEEIYEEPIQESDKYATDDFFQMLKRQFIKVTDISEDKKKEGEFTEYHGNGKIALKGNYKNGNKYGEWTYFDTKNNLRLKENYVNGQLHDKQYFYNNNGAVKAEIPFRNGLLHGMVVMYDDSGNAVKNYFFIDGKKLENSTEFYQRFYTTGVETKGNVQIIDLDKTNDPYKIEEKGEETEKKKPSHLVLDTVSNDNGVCHASVVLNKQELNSFSKNIDNILLNIYTTTDGIYILKTHHSYEPKDNEIAFFYQYPGNSKMSNQRMLFRLGKDIKTVLKNKSLPEYKVIDVLENRVFKTGSFSGLSAAEALENELK